MKDVANRIVRITGAFARVLRDVEILFTRGLIA
jgi:hypothetical protein